MSWQSFLSFPTWLNSIICFCFCFSGLYQVTTERKYRMVSSECPGRLTACLIVHKGLAVLPPSNSWGVIFPLSLFLAVRVALNIMYHLPELLAVQFILRTFPLWLLVFSHMTPKFPPSGSVGWLLLRPAFWTHNQCSQTGHCSEGPPFRITALQSPSSNPQYLSLWICALNWSRSDNGSCTRTKSFDSNFPASSCLCFSLGWVLSCLPPFLWLCWPGYPCHSLLCKSGWDGSTVSPASVSSGAWVWVWAGWGLDMDLAVFCSRTRWQPSLPRAQQCHRVFVTH